MRVVVLGSAAGGSGAELRTSPVVGAVLNNGDLDHCIGLLSHVNDTKPILREGSPERRAVEARGWAVAEDGLEIVL